MMLFGAHVFISRASKCSPRIAVADSAYSHVKFCENPALFSFPRDKLPYVCVTRYPHEIVSGCVCSTNVFYTVRTSAALPCGKRTSIVDWQFSLYLAFDKFPQVCVIQILSVHAAIHEIASGKLKIIFLTISKLYSLNLPCLFNIDRLVIPNYNINYVC